MSYTVIRETVDYLNVINHQIDRCAELGTKYWQDKAPSRQSLKQFVGCVWQLYYLTQPLIGSIEVQTTEEPKARKKEKLALDPIEQALLDIMKIGTEGNGDRDPKPGRAWIDANRVLMSIVQALHSKGLLVRTSVLSLEG